MKRHKLPITDPLPAEIIQTGVNVLRSDVYKIIYSIRKKGITATAVEEV
jgi:hypothetical protein